MPREIVLGNGELLINLDDSLSVRDLYFPYVGWANHVAGYRCRLGVWTKEGGLAWLGDPGWEREISYEPGTLVTNCVMRHTGQRVRLTLNQAVLHDKNLYVQRILVENLSEESQEIRVFSAHDLRIDESDIGDTAFYHPWFRSLIHYKRDRYFLFGGEVSAGIMEGSEGIWQYACGEKGFRGAEGTWRDAEDGLLSMNAIAQGSVDSVVSYRMATPGRESGTLHLWMAADESLEEVGALQDVLLEQGVDSALDETAKHGKLFVQFPLGREEQFADLPPRVVSLFHRSLLTIRTQADRRGAILASNDSDIMETARAHYSYMWPRDGALVSYALDSAGNREISRSFFEFCARVLPKDRAALMHKYGPDGTLGASWHPWVVDGDPEVPFQEDGTALVVWALEHHCRRHEDHDFLASHYRRFARPAAQFLMEFRDPLTHLPLPSWDVWEERHGTHIWTTCAVIAALGAAASLARRMGDTPTIEPLRVATEQTQAALVKHFWDEESGCFARMVNTDDAGRITRDLTVDSSASAVFAFGILAPDDPKVVSTMEALGRKLWVKSGSGGLARYERDYYFRVTEDFDKVPGNPWIICTLWLADWYIARATKESEMRGALDLLEWACRCALPTGILPEQVHPHTLQPLSVAPLTWSHAQYVQTVMNYVEKREILRG